MRLIDAETLTACAVAPGDTVLAGFSGGADSTALVHALWRCVRERQIAGLCAAHFNHGLRGAAADADEAFCRDFCRERGIPFVSARSDVRLLARERGKSVEEAGRDARYAFLREAARSCGASCVAVAHHRDDQAETLLLRLLRGTGLRGLCGMRSRADDIVRPLLFASRAEIERYLAENGLCCRTDETNLVPEAALRNRVRLELLPAMDAVVPRAAEHLAHTARLLAADEAFLSGLARDALRAAALPGEDGYDRAALVSAPEPVRVRALALLLFPLLEDVTASDLRRVGALLSAQTGTRIELAGGRAAWVDATALHVGDAPRENAFCVPFAKRGDTRFPGGRFTAEPVSAFARPGDASVACVDLNALPEDTVVRTRLPGDRFYPLGAPGSRKLSDCLIDRKLPQARRDLPLLASGDEILFVPGYTVSERLRVGTQTRRMLRITYCREETSL